MNPFKSTMAAISHNFFINVMTVLLLSMLFYSELNLYHYCYYSYTVIKARQQTDFSRSTYTFEFKHPMDLLTLDSALKQIPAGLRDYEDIVVLKRITTGGEANTALISFYKGMSPLHSFVSDHSSEMITENLLDSQRILATNEFGMSSTLQLNEDTFRIIQNVHGLNSYVPDHEYDTPPVILCGSPDVYNDNASDVDVLFIEYRTPLTDDEASILCDFWGNYSDITATKPTPGIVDSLDTIKGVSFELVEIFLTMFIVTACVLPIIRYCLWKRVYEFTSYRICGASRSFVFLCKMLHVIILGSLAVAIGVLLSWTDLRTRGFWVMMIISVFIFIARLLLEVMIVEENKKWIL